MFTLLTIVSVLILCVVSFCLGYFTGHIDTDEPIDKDKALDGVKRFK